jgi:polyisoprenoid-binding protein YceI
MFLLKSLTVIGLLSAISIQNPSALSTPDDLLDGRELFGIDAAHSELSFRIGFLGINNVRGTFADYSAAILYDDNDVTRTSLTLIIDVASIATQNDWRDNDLRSDRFFDAERYPNITFQSDRIDETDDGYVLHGRLTIKDVTKEVAIPFARTLARMEDGGWGNVRIGFAGELTLNRKEYDVLGNDFWGNTVLSEEVVIEFSVLGIRSNFERWGFSSSEKTSVAEVMQETISTAGHQAAIEQYHMLKVDSADAYGFGSRDLNTLGYKQLQAGNVDAAIAIFGLAGEENPGEASLLDSLGEAYLAAGDRENAIQSYQAALDVDPAIPAALEVLRFLESGSG